MQKSMLKKCTSYSLTHFFALSKTELEYIKKLTYPYCIVGLNYQKYKGLSVTCRTKCLCFKNHSNPGYFMKLYGSYTSPYVRHCRVALLEAGLAFEFVETDFSGSAKKSPTQRVPFLEDGNQFFTDSSSIIKYLREKVGTKFCASAKELDDFCLVNSALDATTNLFFIERDGVQIADIPYLLRQAARIETILGELNAMELPVSAPYNDAHLRLACYMGWAKFRKRVDFTPFSNLENFFANANHYEIFRITTPG